MDTSDLLTRRDHLIEHARQTLTPLQAWCDQHSIANQQDKIPSYFHQRIGTIVQEATTTLDRLATQHPRYLTEKKLKDLERRFGTLPEAWQWLLREAHLFETLRPQVKPTVREMEALLDELEESVDQVTWAYRDMREAKPYGAWIAGLEPILKEAAFTADLAKKVLKRSATINETYHRTYWRDLAPPPLSPNHRFCLEHDRLCLKFLETHAQQLKTQFFAIHTPLATLTNRITTALPEWRGILNLLDDTPLTTYAWHCHRDLEALADGHDLSLAELQHAFEMTHMAVQEAFQAQFQKRLP